MSLPQSPVNNSEDIAEIDSLLKTVLDSSIPSDLKTRSLNMLKKIL